MESRGQSQTPQQQPGGGGRLHSIPLDILDDLASRFIINAPEGLQQDMIRLCFQIELAHWFFIDEYVSDRRHRVASCTLREFAEHMFRHVAFLRARADDVEAILDEWRAYKMSVPTNGAVIMNEDLTKVLLVQGFWTKTSWGFPKGKVNEEESAHVCAAREVLEETGFDIAPHMDPEQFFETVIQDQIVRLYPIPGVSEDTQFQPRTKNEIRDWRWFNVSELPTSRGSQASANTPRPAGMSPNHFFMVVPFVKTVKQWISAYKRGHIPFRSTTRDSYAMRRTPSAFTPKGKRARKESKTLREETAIPALDPMDPRLIDVPKVWSNFKFKKKEIFAAMAATPGWI